MVQRVSARLKCWCLFQNSGMRPALHLLLSEAMGSGVGGHEKMVVGWLGDKAIAGGAL